MQQSPAEASAPASEGPPRRRLPRPHCRRRRLTHAREAAALILSSNALQVFMKVPMVARSWRWACGSKQSISSPANVAEAALFGHEIGCAILGDCCKRKAITRIRALLIWSSAGSRPRLPVSPRSRVAASTTDLWYDGHSDRMVADVWLHRLILGPPDWGNCPPYPYLFNGCQIGWYPPDQLLDCKTLDDHQSRYRARAAALVARLWPQIERVAIESLRRKVLSFDEVRRLMTRRRRGRRARSIVGATRPFKSLPDDPAGRALEPKVP